MQQFKAVFINELSRVFAKRKTIVFFAVNVLLIVLNSLVLRSSNPILTVLGRAGSLHGIFFMVVFPLYIFMETLGVFTGEMSSLIIRNVLIRPVARAKIYLAKVCAVCAFILVQILFVAVANLVFSVCTGGDILYALKNVAAFIITFIPMIAFVFTAAFIAQLVKNSLLGVVLCVFFLLAAYCAEIFVPMLSNFLFVRHINLYKMLLTGNVQFYAVFSALLIITAYVGVTFTAGVLLFEKKEF